MFDPNAWLKFFRKWPTNKLAVIATLLVFAAAGMGALVGTGVAFQVGRVIIEQFGATSSREAATPTVQTYSGCDSIEPSDGITMPGSFIVEGHCPSMAGADVFIVLKNIFPYETPAEPTPAHARYWVQCRTKVRDGGDFLCGAWGCVDQARYEILVVVPTAAAIGDYDEWLSSQSNIGKDYLPDDGQVQVVGGNRSVKVDHSLGKPSPTCAERAA